MINVYNAGEGSAGEKNDNDDEVFLAKHIGVTNNNKYAFLRTCSLLFYHIDFPK